MNETINLMKAHTSVRRFTEEQISAEELRAIIDGCTGTVGRIPSPIRSLWCAVKKRSPL